MTFRRRLSTKSSVDLVPMIDVSITILFFFMVSTTFNVAPAITMLLPTSQTAEQTTVTTLTVSVKDKYNIYLNQELHSLESLSLRLSAYSEQERREIKSVMVLGDEGVSYALMIEVLDALRIAGFQSINLKTRVPGGK
ncbi:MAG: biopolymer transporter ExbD [Spirochaetes bacterium GWB1_48_6]|nr:MAG: biopolymer transporter ExbD [Spirochaetes bacterium GWB1_48_6]